MVLILKYFQFPMVDNVYVIDHVHEVQIMVSKLDLKVEIPERLEVGTIIGKLAPR